MELKRGEYTISCDAKRLDVGVVHRFLQKSYWAPNVTEDVVRRSIEHSLCFGVYHQETQVGFARVITDYATFAYLADVFIVEPHRGHGLGKWLIEAVVSHPHLNGLRRWILLTRDAHDLYRKYGFTELRNPERFMERYESHVDRVSTESGSGLVCD
jgi:GNAT superfamily N-acetyltransferase